MTDHIWVKIDFEGNFGEHGVEKCKRCALIRSKSPVKTSMISSPFGYLGYVYDHEMFSNDEWCRTNGKEFSYMARNCEAVLMRRALK